MLYYIQLTYQESTSTCGTWNKTHTQLMHIDVYAITLKHTTDAGTQRWDTHTLLIIPSWYICMGQMWVSHLIVPPSYKFWAALEEWYPTDDGTAGYNCVLIINCLQKASHVDILNKPGDVWLLTHAAVRITLIASSKGPKYRTCGYRVCVKYVCSWRSNEAQNSDTWHAKTHYDVMWCHAREGRHSAATPHTHST